MKHSDFQILENQYSKLGPSWLGGLWSLFLRSGSTGLALYLSQSSDIVIWLIGQIILGFSMFHWFSILHDSGHSAFFPGKLANVVTGFVASIFCFVPYSSWKYVHLEHHRWTGWLDQDPSTRDLLKVTPGKKILARIVWKSYFPGFACAFLLGTFWNVKKLMVFFPNLKIRSEIIFNLVVIIIAHVILARYFGTWWQTFGVAFVLFGVICEPIILSQHVHIPMEKEQSNPVAFALHEQDKYTRALAFPEWVSRYLTLSFENHIAHHFFPWIPSYLLYQIKTETGNEVNAFQWIRAARKIPGDVLLFKDRNQTGLEI